MPFIHVAPDDPRAAPLLADLLREYTERYGPGASREFERYPVERFTAEHGGAFVLATAGDAVPVGSDGTAGGDAADRDEVVAGGAFMRSDAVTAEVKRMWTHRAHRRRGHAARVLAELEREAGRRGYRRIVLSTGPRQPEAVALYRRLGYAPDPGVIDYHAFVKDLPPAA